MFKKWLDREFMGEKFGWIFSKKWLDFLLSKNIITKDEYDKYILYSPTSDSLITSLENEWSIYNISKLYFPDEVWAQDWQKQAIKDFLVETITLLDPRDIPDLLIWVKNWIVKVATHDYNKEELKQALWDIYVLYENIDETLAWLDDYKKSYYKSYLTTKVWISLLPIWRLKAIDKVKGKGDSKTLGKIKKRSSIINDSEVKKTLERINNWKSPHKKDWTIFLNDWRWLWEKLPNKPNWYYTEWTVDTPWISTRWARRIVIWKWWERYYTEDHYSTFIKIK